jgi:phosphohistidine phosphatase
MDLFVLRHAIAVERGHPDYLRDDAKRPLTRKGVRRMRRVVRGLKRAGLDFDVVLSSPYKRARETAEIVVEMLHREESLELFQPLAPEIPPEQTIRQLWRRCEKLDSVLLVGHEPQLSAIGSLLLAGDSGLALELGKGGAFKIEVDQLQPGTAILDWWLTPRQLRRLGE